MKGRLRFAAFLLGGLAALSAPLSAQTRASGPQGEERVLFDSANRERVARHLSALQWDENLARAAHDHAVLMARIRVISHQYPGEPSLSSRLVRAGVHFSIIAENVGDAANAPELHGAWMKSPGHRANLLEPKLNAVGIAVAENAGLIYAVEDFARMTTFVSFDEQEHRVAAQLAARGLRVVQTTSDVRQTCALSRGVAPGLRPKYLFRYITEDLANLPDELLAELDAHADQYHSAAVGACPASETGDFEGYRLAILLY